MKNTILTVLFYSCLKLFAEVRSSASFLTDDTKNSTLKSRIVLPEYYVKDLNQKIRPPSKQGFPVVVDFNIFVADINSINVEDMDFRVDMFVRQSWIESRLDMPDEIFEEGDDYVTLPPEFFDSLWQPDLYFLNAKVSEIAALNHKFSSVTLYRNKTVKYSARMHAIIACQMEFQLYPMDIQICPIYIESFSYHKQKLRLRWGLGAVTVNPELKLLQYDIGKPVVAEETVDYMLEKSGNFSRLVVFFRFERQIGHHLIQTFAPSTLVVMLSWFSFWLGLDAIPGRVALLVTSMLTLVTMFTGLKSDIPPVAYVKRIVAMEKGQSIWDYDSTYIPKARNKRAGSKHLLQNAWLDTEYPMIRVCKTRSQKIDNYSRIGFPILFMLFVILYWPILLFKKAT
ncbi:glycine receptor subunit alpha-4 isoform X4 [Bombus terrestris]|uniref:Glycine receptor subunit alpha-4 isoform X4 n=1 Tax=Bombus terrestris TaxID=30195 RepID=A0A9C6SI99_BOMTE|nr:glycine receptor subunit alpha-4 isoform X4 [Bombus terrestris]